MNLYTAVIAIIFAVSNLFIFAAGYLAAGQWTKSGMCLAALAVVVVFIMRTHHHLRRVFLEGTE